jgi:hypothetical protein
LIRADSPDEAYEKAVSLGYQGEASYDNPNGQLVQIRFRGLADLDVIYDELGHGAELLFHEQVGVEPEEIEKNCSSEGETTRLSASEAKRRTRLCLEKSH